MSVIHNFTSLRSAVWCQFCLSYIPDTEYDHDEEHRCIECGDLHAADADCTEDDADE